MWQMGSAPYLGGGFGHFYAYAPAKIEYAIDRNKVSMSRVLMYELFVFQTLVDREAPNVEQEPVTMIQHDRQSRWKAWMRMLAVDIRPISMSMLQKSTALSTGVTRPGVLSTAMRPSSRRPELRLALIQPAPGTRQ